MSNNDYVEDVLIEFVEAAGEKDFIILIDPDDPDQFVQFMRQGGTIYAEVSSRQWEVPARPISDAAELALMRLGFTHGGGAKNYARDGLTADGPFLTDLARRAFATAYGRPLPNQPKVASTVASVIARVRASGGRVEPVKPSGQPPRDFPCPICDPGDPFGGADTATGPGLLLRARRAARSNFVRIQMDCEEHVIMVDAVNQAKTFNDLPEQVQDWILKAEDGPLFG